MHFLWDIFLKNNCLNVFSLYSEFNVQRGNVFLLIALHSCLSFTFSTSWNRIYATKWSHKTMMICHVVYSVQRIHNEYNDPLCNKYFHSKLVHSALITDKYVCALCICLLRIYHSALFDLAQLSITQKQHIILKTF